MRLVNSARAAAVAAALIGSAGCAANRYAVPVQSFRDSTQRTIGTLRDFYQSRNAYEVDLYLSAVAADPTQEALAKDRNGRPTPLGRPIFAADSVAARLNALDLVGAYSGRLAQLAGSDAPARFRDAAELLGTNLSSLDKTFQKLSPADESAARFVTPIANLIGAIGEMVLENKRDALVTAGIEKGEQPVHQVLMLLRDDMDNIFGLEENAGDAERLAILIDAYNRERQQLGFEQRKARLEEIKAAQLTRATAAQSVPAALVTSMMDAEAALIQLARSPRKPVNFADLNTALALWATRVEYLAGQLKTLAH